MLLAEKKKQKNISEYIIFMYQTEDLIRVYNFDISLIEKFVVNHFPVSEQEKKKNLDWYNAILIRMEFEGIISSGHLKEVQDIVAQLSNLSKELLGSDTEYQKIYATAKSYIDEHLLLAEGKVSDEIQICLNGIYGYLLLRMNDEKIDENLMKPLNAFGDLLSYLSFMYKKIYQQ